MSNLLTNWCRIGTIYPNVTLFCNPNKENCHDRGGNLPECDFRSAGRAGANLVVLRPAQDVPRVRRRRDTMPRLCIRTDHERSVLKTQAPGKLQRFRTEPGCAPGANSGSGSV